MFEKQNYKINKSLRLPDSPVSGQALGEVGKMRFGLRQFSKVGSGVVAVYNLLLLLEREANLLEICTELYKKAAYPLGIFGTRPMRLIRYFAAHYIPVTLDTSFSDFNRKFSKAGCGIIAFWTGKRFFSRVHCVAVENLGNKIMVYNRFPNRQTVYEFRNIGELVGEKNFIVGYFI